LGGLSELTGDASDRGGYKSAMDKIPFPMPLPASEWLPRCSARIAQLDPTLADYDVAALATALANRPSCRALEPERAVELLFDNRLSAPTWDLLGEQR